MSNNERCRRPCANCPWRKDAPREYWDPEHFREIWQGCQDDGLHMMLCHHASQVAEPADKPICQGWVRVMGYEAIGVRIALIRERVSWNEIEDREGPELFATFDDMLVANGIAPPERNRFIRDAVQTLERLKKGTS
jgi:hypothetical protein